MSKAEDPLVVFDDNGGKDFPALDFDAQIADQEAAPPILKPKIAKPAAEVAKPVEPVTQDVEEVRILNNRIKDMENAIALLQLGRDNIRLKAANIERKPVDWAKITEKDIFDLSMPIDVVDHTTPDYMKVESADDNFVLRWVQKMPRRLGPMKAMGFVFCTKADIRGELNIAIEADENGAFRFDDVILMKIEKRKYYGMLRKNHERAVQMVDPKAAHKAAKNRVMGDIRSGTTSKDVAGEVVNAGDFDHYVNDNKLNVYAPGMEI